MRQKGFTYIGLLLLVAMTTSALAVAATLWSLESRREKEADLLFIGAEFRQAIASFRERTPAGQAPRFPQRLEELVDDRRWPAMRRHLRQVYVDPMTGSRDWGLVTAPGGGILGVYSRSEAAPVKRSRFPEDYEGFDDAPSYQQWRFVYSSPGGPAQERN
jgi:type II secretory pathway pseudopilin PulG